MAASAQASASASFPRLRWLGVLWLVVYLPAYAQAWGAANFLFLCNIGVILTAIGLIARSRLLLSSQAVAAPIIALVEERRQHWHLLQYLDGQHVSCYPWVKWVKTDWTN